MWRNFQKKASCSIKTPNLGDLGMLFTVQQHIEESFSNLLHGRSFSLTEIICTNPVFLVFAEGDNYPTFVLKTGKPSILTKNFEVMRQLHDKLGDLVAEPISVSDLNDTTSVLTQRGIQGTPWLRLKNRGDADNIKQLAIGSLETLHNNVRTIPEWQQETVPFATMSMLIDTIEKSKLVDVETISDLKHVADQLRKCGPVKSWHQHGDFCINNLIVTDSQAHIIDMDDFGNNSTPLHDCFSLASSLGDFLSDEFRIDKLMQHAVDCLARVPFPAKASDYLSELRIHQLCFEIVQATKLGRETRQERLLNELSLTLRHYKL